MSSQGKDMKNVFKHKINFMQIWSEHNWVRKCIRLCVLSLWEEDTYVRIVYYGFLTAFAFSFCLNILIENYNNVGDLRCVLLCVWVLWPEVINGFMVLLWTYFNVLSVPVFQRFQSDKREDCYRQQMVEHISFY